MGGDKLRDQIFNLKFTSKQLVRQARKSEKEEKSEKLKIKKAIEKGNIDGAKIYAQNAIRKKNEALNYMRLGSRLDAVVSRLDTQAKMQVRLIGTVLCSPPSSWYGSAAMAQPCLIWTALSLEADICCLCPCRQSANLWLA